jgi:hypothetical protein
VFITAAELHHEMDVKYLRLHEVLKRDFARDDKADANMNPWKFARRTPTNIG